MQRKVKKFKAGIYRLDSRHYNKSKALNRATRLRNKGYRARIISDDYSWEVWRR